MHVCRTSLRSTDPAHASVRGPPQLPSRRLDPPLDHADDREGTAQNGKDRSHVIVPGSSLDSVVNCNGRNVKNEFGLRHAVVTIQSELVARGHVVVVRVGRYQLEIMMPRFVRLEQNIRRFVQRRHRFTKHGSSSRWTSFGYSGIVRFERQVMHDMREVCDTGVEVVS